MGFFSRSNERANMTDEQAVERYRYMLRTAPPDAIEQAHEEAFERLTPEQRRMALDQLASAATPHERRVASDDPKALARLATRAEIRQPGILERLFGRVGNSGYGAAGFGGAGGMLAGSLLSSVAGSFIGSAIAHSFFDQHGGFDTANLADSGQSGYDTADSADTTNSVDTVDDAGIFDDTSGFDGGDFDV